jgi:predicted O-methyltransferase YrrM
MNAARRAIADDVLEAARAHDAAQADRLARFRNVEPETAALLGVLVRAGGARRVLELGTSNGYSTLWLADAVEGTGGAGHERRDRPRPDGDGARDPRARRPGGRARHR